MSPTPSWQMGHEHYCFSLFLQGRSLSQFTTVMLPLILKASSFIQISASHCGGKATIYHLFHMKLITFYHGTAKGIRKSPRWSLQQCMWWTVLLVISNGYLLFLKNCFWTTMKHSKHLSLLIKQGQICNQVKESKYLYQVDNYHKLPVSLCTIWFLWASLSRLTPTLFTCFRT